MAFLDHWTKVLDHSAFIYFFKSVTRASVSMHIYAAMVVYWPSFSKEGEGEDITRL